MFIEMKCTRCNKKFNIIFDEKEVQFNKCPYCSFKYSGNDVERIHNFAEKFWSIEKYVSDVSLVGVYQGNKALFIDSDFERIDEIIKCANPELSRQMSSIVDKLYLLFNASISDDDKKSQLKVLLSCLEKLSSERISQRNRDISVELGIKIDKAENKLEGDEAMKRNMNFVRKVLLAIEEQYVKPKHDESADVFDFIGKQMSISDLKIDGMDESLVGTYHSMLAESGLIEKGSMPFYYVSDLTWEGRDFLEEIRDDATWQEIKSIIENKKLPFTVSVIREISKILVSKDIKSALDPWLQQVECAKETRTNLTNKNNEECRDE